MVLRTPRPLRRIRRPMAQRILPGMAPRTPPLRRLIRLMALRIPQVPTRSAAATAHAPRVVLPICLSRPTRRLRPQGRTHPQQQLTKSHRQSPAAVRGRVRRRRPCEPHSTLHSTTRMAR